MTPLYHSRPERWPQVSLKGLFALLTIVGIFLGWLTVQLKWIQDRRETVAKWMIGFPSSAVLIGYNYPPKPHPYAPWSIRIFGELGVGVIYIKVGDDGDLPGLDFRVCLPEEEAQSLSRELGGLFPESRIELTRPPAIPTPPTPGV